MSEYAGIMRPPSTRRTVALVAAWLALAAAAAPLLAAPAPGQAPTVAPAAAPGATPGQAPGPRRNTAGPGDYALREKLVHLVSRDPELGQEKFGLVLVNGGAVFSGQIKSCALRTRLLRLAALTRGVVNVTDETSVAHADLPDEALQKAVEASLRDAAGALGLKDSAVSVRDSVAILEGSVKDFTARVRAEDIAGAVLGVTRVSNHLVPADAPSGSDDASLSRAVVGYLSNPLQFSLDADLQVRAKDGVVSLAGKSSLFIARQQAAVMASLVKGVARVENRIKVDPGLQVREPRIVVAP